MCHFLVNPNNNNNNKIQRRYSKCDFGGKFFNLGLISFKENLFQHTFI